MKLQISSFLVFILFVSFAHSQTSYSCGADGRALVTETILEGRIQPLDYTGIVYLGRWTNVTSGLVVLAKTDQGILYRSDDDGKTWGKANVPAGNGSSAVNDIFVSINPSKVLLQPRDDYSSYWVSDDGGFTFTLVKPKDGQIFTYFDPHPYIEDWILAESPTLGCIEPVGKGACHWDLWVSKDWGHSWTLLTTYVNTWDWALHGLNPVGSLGNNSVVITGYVSKSGNQALKNQSDLAVMRSDDLFKTSAKVLSTRSPAFLINNGVFFVAQLDKEGDVTLFSSLDGGSTFTPCIFPTDAGLTEYRYTIVDAENNTAAINVDHSKPNTISWGHVYTSDSFDKDFSLSLHFNKRGDTRYGTGGLADFERVRSLRGIYLANVLTASGVEPTRASKTYTVISFNRGGDWDRIPAPANNNSCEDMDNCWLNLNGPTTSNLGRFYSDSNAIGVILATGNVGPYLEPNAPNTYYSRDGGMTWDLIAAGPHTYDLADHGALVLLATLEASSNSLQYSLNEGLAWIDCELNDQYYFDNVLAEPLRTGQSFVVFGRRVTDNAGVILQVDFSQIDEPDCLYPDDVTNPNSDYEYWSPSDYMNGTCLLGVKTVYVRKQREAQCHDPIGTPERPISAAVPCPCTRMDFECATCYVLNDMNDCEFDETQCSEVPSEAEEPYDCEDYYYAFNGYRLVGGDGCNLSDPSSMNLLGEKRRCSLFHLRSSGATVAVIFLVLLLILGAAVGAFIYAARNNDRVKDYLSRKFPGMFNGVKSQPGASASYSSLHANDEEDNFEADSSQEAKELDDDTIISSTKASEAFRSHEPADEFDPRAGSSSPTMTRSSAIKEGNLV